MYTTWLIRVQSRVKATQQIEQSIFALADVDMAATFVQHRAADPEFDQIMYSRVRTHDEHGRALHYVDADGQPLPGLTTHEASLKGIRL